MSSRRCPTGWITAKTVWHVNPTGKFFIGGPDGDCGLTGRKIIVDTYGGAAPHGGGAFSGKDPTKVDRSAAYAARYLAKNVVAAGLADRCTIQLSYAIGVAKPLSIYVDLHGTGQVDEGKLEQRADGGRWTSRRAASASTCKLNRPIFARTSAYGHFGRAPEADGGFSWEKTDLAERSALPTSRRTALAEPTPEAPKRRTLYGRSKGKALRPHQAQLVADALPALEVDAARLAAGASLFDFAPRELWLEIGFGGGEHLIAQALAHPDVGIIGCEPFINGVAKALGRRRAPRPRQRAAESRRRAAGWSRRRRRRRCRESSCSIPTHGRNGAIASAASSRASRSPS